MTVTTWGQQLDPISYVRSLMSEAEEMTEKLEKDTPGHDFWYGRLSALSSVELYMREAVV